MCEKQNKYARGVFQYSEPNPSKHHILFSHMSQRNYLLRSKPNPRRKSILPFLVAGIYVCKQSTDEISLQLWQP